MGVAVPVKVKEFLAHKITSNARELEGALTRLVAHAQLVGRELSLETAHEVLADLLRAYDRRVTIEEIQKKVAEHFQVRVADMHSARRARAVTRPRQVAMYLSKQLTSRSLPEIGRKFGGRDHTTVMHAVKKVEELVAGDAAFAEDHPGAGAPPPNAGPGGSPARGRTASPARVACSPAQSGLPSARVAACLRHSHIWGSLQGFRQDLERFPTVDPAPAAPDAHQPDRRR
jgi:hypothetical protein